MFNETPPKSLPHVKGTEILTDLDLIYKKIRTSHKRRISDLHIDNIFLQMTKDISKLHECVKPYFLTKKRKIKLLHLIKAGNTCASLADAVNNNEIEHSEISEARDDIIVDLLAFTDSVKSVMSPLPKQDTTSQTVYGWEEGLIAAIKDKNPDEDLFVEDQDNRRLEVTQLIENKYAKLLTDAKSSSKDYVIKRLPIIPLNSNVSFNGFRKADIEAKALDGYKILEDQIILCINMIALRKRDKKGNHRMYADSIIRDIKKKKNIDYILIGSCIRYTKKKTGFLYYWVMPASKIDILCDVSPKTLGTEWGFAF